MKKISLILFCTALFLGITTFEYGKVQAYSEYEPAAVNKEYQGKLDTPNDIYYHRIEITEPGTLKLNFKMKKRLDDTPVYHVRFYDSEKQVLSIDEIPGNQDSYTTSVLGVKKGTYYAEINAGAWFSDDQFSYTYEFIKTNAWEKENNNSIEVATSFSLNTTIYGATTNGDDVDFYKIQVLEPGVLDLNMKHTLLPFNFDYWNMVLYDQEGNQLLSTGINGRAASNESNKIGLDQGTYYVRITSEFFTDITYSLTSTFTERNDWEKEYNQDWAHASYMVLNKATYGAINYKEDQDYYKFVLPNDGVIDVTFQHDLVKDTQNLWNFALLDSNGNIMLRSSFVNGLNTSASLRKIGLQKGTYYLYVGGENNTSTVPYMITTSFVKTDVWEKEENYDMGIATEIPIDKAMNGNINYPNDKDYYRFRVNNRQGFNIELKHDKTNVNDGWYIKLYDGNGNIVNGFTSTGLQTSISESIMLDSDYYFLEVSGNGIDQQLYTVNVKKHTLSVNPTKATLSVGKSFQLKATSFPTSKLVYTSGNNKILKVDATGKVTAVGKGSTYVYVRNAEGLMAKSLITVVDNMPTSVKLNTEYATLSIGNGFQAKATVSPSGANSSVTWRSSSPSIASVDARGNVKALKAGYTYIIAKTANGLETKCLVKVIEIKPNKINMNISSATLSIGKSFNAKATVYPINATNKNVTWSSANTKVVKVDANGKVTTVGAGTTYVYAKTSNGITGKIQVKVLPNPTSVTITPKSATVKVGATFKARGIVTPSNATSSVTFKSSSPSIATVDSSGNVKAIKEGYTYISVTTINGKTAKFLLHVVK